MFALPATLGNPASMLEFDAAVRPGQSAHLHACHQRDRAVRVPNADRVGADREGFSAAMTHCRIGGCWATWSNSYAGDVDATGATLVTMTLPDTNAFYFYAEPQQFANMTFTATTANGTTSGPIAVNGNSGARYFGFYTTGKSPLTSITVTTSDVPPGSRSASSASRRRTSSSCRCGTSRIRPS